MEEIIIGKHEAGQRLDKFLLKYLNRAPSSLIHKFLRKKDIRLNGQRADGSELLRSGDSILIRLPAVQITDLREETRIPADLRAYPHIDVIYEDADVLILNKPAGILTQKASAGDVSLNEELLAYTLDTGAVTAESLQFFRPSVCNRLDRNTAGLVLAAKNLPAAKCLNELIRSRRIGKFYRCLVSGRLDSAQNKEAWLLKDPGTNTARILAQEQPGAVRIETKIYPLSFNEHASLLEIELITGKSHQIRAQLAAMGHPVLGDPKYGLRDEKYGRKKKHAQALVACRLVFPQDCGTLAQLNGKTVTAPLPDWFRKLQEESDL